MAEEPGGVEKAEEDAMPVPVPADLDPAKLAQADLARRLAAKEPAAVDDLLRRFWPPAYRIALQVTGDPSAAEDAAQEAFVRALQAAPTLEPGRPLRPWLFRIVSNTACNALRERGRRERREQAAARPERAATPGPDEAAARDEEVGAVRAALASLSPRLRHALTLRYLEGLPLAEVAEVLGCPEGTVSSRVRRGLVALRQSLEPAVQHGLAAAPALAALARATAVPAAPAASEVSAAAAAGALGADPAAALDPLLHAPPLTGSGSSWAGALEAPPPPSSELLLDLASEGAGLTRRGIGPALSAALLALILGAGLGAVALVAPEQTAPPPPDAVEVAAILPEGEPTAPSAAAVPDFAPAGPLQVACLVPERVWLGDRFEAAVRVTLPPGLEAGRVELGSRVEGGLAGEPPRQISAEAGVALFAVPLEATAPGAAALRVVARAPEAAEVTSARSEAQLVVDAPGREVGVAHDVVLSGPEAVAQVRLDPRVSKLRSPRSVALRVAPGLAAEATLALQALARQPTGCFEQTTAATYPSLVLVDLERRGVALTEAAQQAREFAHQGLERLRRFQHTSGAFSLHPGDTPSLWLTALGLQELAALSEAGLPVEPDRIERAVAGLLGWRRADGSFPSLGRVSAFAVTAYAVGSLRTAGRLAEAEASLAWLGAHVDGAAQAYELALGARALAGLEGSDHQVEALVRGLVSLARPGPDGGLYWKGGATLTGAGGRAGDVETTGLAAQALVRHGGYGGMVRDALLWLVRQRDPLGGFWSTRATVAALEALRIGGWQGAEGRLELALGRFELDPLPVKQGDLRELELGPPTLHPEVALDEALLREVRLRFVGEGDLHVQLVARGLVPWEEAERFGASDEASARARGLRVQLERPSAGRVGEAQRWLLRVRNTRDETVEAPMVELALPAGDLLAGDAGVGGLPAQTGRGRAVAAHERGPRGLVLYLQPLPAGVERRVALEVVPTVAGELSSGGLRAYLYYDREVEHLGAPVKLTVLPLDAPAIEPAPEPTASASGSESPAERRDDAEEEEPLAAPPPWPAEVTIGWDAALGKLSCEEELLGRGWSPSSRLLVGLLRTSLPQVAVVEQVTAREWVFRLQEVRWSDGTPLEAEHFARAWRAAARRPAEALGSADLLDLMRVEVVGPRELRVRLREPLDDLAQRLDGFPFYPAPPPLTQEEQQAQRRARRGRELQPGDLRTCGPYAVTDLSEDEVVLVRRPHAPPGPPRIRIVRERSRRKAERHHLVWSARWVEAESAVRLDAVGLVLRGAPADVGRILAAGYPPLQERLFGDEQERFFPSARAWPRGGGGPARRPPLDGRRVSVGAATRDTVRLAALLRSRLQALGLEVELADARRSDPAWAHLDVLVARGHILAQAHQAGEEVVILADAAAPVAPGTRAIDPTSFDANGYLRHPLRLLPVGMGR